MNFSKAVTETYRFGSGGDFANFYLDTSVRAIAPLPWKGSQGWREVGPEFKNQIKFLES